MLWNKIPPDPVLLCQDLNKEGDSIGRICSIVFVYKSLARNKTYFLIPYIYLFEMFYPVFWICLAVCVSRNKFFETRSIYTTYNARCKLFLVLIMDKISWTFNWSCIKAKLKLKWDQISGFNLTLLVRGGWIGPHFIKTSISSWKKGSGGPKLCNFS